MAGYRYTQDERNLLANLTKNALKDFDSRVKDAIKNGDENGAYASMKLRDVANSALAKLEGEG